MLIVLFLFSLIRSLHGIPLDLAGNETDSSLAESTDPTPHRARVDIVVGCISTVFTCTVTAYHPSILAPNTSTYGRYWSVAKATIYALLAPELLTIWALQEYIRAKKIMNEYNKEIYKRTPSSSEESSEFGAMKELFRETKLSTAPLSGFSPWTMTHGFFVQMGGFMLTDGGRPAYVLRETGAGPHEEQLIYNIKHQIIHVPSVTEEDIKDLRRGDSLSKFFTAVQVAWFVIQCTARWVYHLTLTELEVIVLGFAVLNGITYAFWWHKPQSVERPIYLEIRPGAKTRNYQPAPRVGKKSWLRRKLQYKEGSKEEPYWALLITVPWYMLLAYFRAVGKLLERDGDFHDAEASVFYADDGSGMTYVTIVVIAIYGALFGAVHLVPSAFLQYSSLLYQWLWFSSVIIITAGPLLFSLTAFFASFHLNTLFTIFVVPTTISLFLYPFARLGIMALAFISINQLATHPDDPALKAIDWTGHIPHW